MKLPRRAFLKHMGVATAGFAGAASLPAGAADKKASTDKTMGGATEKPSAAVAKRLYVPKVQTHTLHSKFVDQAYEIRVMQPLMRRGENERFPVLYLTDGNANFDVAKGISWDLQGPGQVRRFIVVGICYPGENPFTGSVLRMRDYTSQYRKEIPGWTPTSAIEGVPEIAEGKKRWHGADQFLSFIRNELVPFIDGKYPTVPGERAYFGHSLGGGLALHTLFSQPDLFKGYIASSPSISYDGDDYAIREAQDFIASGKRADARLYMTVGEEEELTDSPTIAKPHFVSSVFRMGSLLKQAKIAGLDLKVRSYDGETHMSVWPMAFTHGIQYIFGPADRSPMA